ncbi:MAG: hypothetical protein EOO70_08245 [Myxococcaceae bacterium]|nr:MAG: hypothetical protein EOO70_08245 [Myxococcaceae bacterium]
MKHLFFQALCAALMLLSGGLAHAHGGYENETEVQLYPDRMRIVTRTSLPFAWRLLGDKAPATSDEAGQAAAKPLLAAAAATLFEVTAGGKPLTPTKTDCVFELHDLHEHAAFVLYFAPPTASPVTVKATFFPLLGELDMGTVAVFDHTADPHRRDIEPLLEKALALQSPSVTFDLGGPEKKASPAPAAAPTPAPVATPPAATPACTFPLPIVVAIAFLLVGAIFAVWKRNQKHPVA